jgi:hypothetical protein
MQSKGGLHSYRAIVSLYEHIHSEHRRYSPVMGRNDLNDPRVSSPSFYLEDFHESSRTSLPGNAPWSCTPRSLQTPPAKGEKLEFRASPKGHLRDRIEYWVAGDVRGKD